MFWVRVRIINSDDHSSSRRMQLSGIPRSGDVLWVQTGRAGEGLRLYVRGVEWSETAPSAEPNEPVLICSDAP